MITADTSVVVALFASWHEGHEGARSALEGEVWLPAHVLLETFSVLTRLPPPHRAASEVVAAFLARQFPRPPLTLKASAYQALPEEARRLGISGGAIYDALIAATAKNAGATLLTRDARALVTYDRMGIEYELVA